jgi:hypothetical protein
MKPARVATMFSRTLHLSSSSRALATLDSQNLSVAPSQPQSAKVRQLQAELTPSVTFQQSEVLKKLVYNVHSLVFRSPRGTSYLHAIEQQAQKTEGDGEFQLTEILYVANGQFKIQTTSTTATAAKELQPKILPRVDFRGGIN